MVSFNSHVMSLWTVLRMHCRGLQRALSRNSVKYLFVQKAVYIELILKVFPAMAVLWGDFGKLECFNPPQVKVHSNQTVLLPNAHHWVNRFSSLCEGSQGEQGILRAASPSEGVSVCQIQVSPWGAKWFSTHSCDNIMALWCPHCSKPNTGSTGRLNKLNITRT